MQEADYLEAIVRYPYLTTYTKIVKVHDHNVKKRLVYAGLFVNQYVDERNGYCDTSITIDFFTRDGYALTNRGMCFFETIPELLDGLERASYIEGLLVFDKDDRVVQEYEFKY